MNKTMGKEDLTQGAIGGKLLLFALPLLASSFIQQLYNTVDLLFVGRMLGTNSTAAVGASSLLTNCLVGFFTGLSVGTSVVVSLAVGQKDEKKIHQTIHTAMGISLAGGLILTIFGLLFSRTFLVLMNTPAEILDEGLVYIRIYLLSMIPLFIYNMNAGIMRARGDSRTPMIYQFVGGVLNVLFDWISLRFWGRGVDGVAWATTFAMCVSALLSVIHLMRRKDAYHFSWRECRIKGSILGEILRIGVPAGFQNLVITLSNIFVQASINRLGVDEIAAFTAYFKVELILYLPIVAFGQAITTYTGQNLGAGRLDRVKKGVRICIAMAAVYTVAAAALLILGGEAAFGLFSSDMDVIRVGLRIIYVTFPFYWLYAFLEVHADALRGAGCSVPPMLIVLFSMCVFRTVLLALFNHLFGTLESVAAVYPCAWLLAAVSLTVYWLIWVRKRGRSGLGADRA